MLLLFYFLINLSVTKRAFKLNVSYRYIYIYKLYFCIFYFFIIFFF